MPRGAYAEGRSAYAEGGGAYAEGGAGALGGARRGRIVFLFNGQHRAGGVASLHALHSALNALGFHSEFHRLNPHYADEWSRDLQHINPEDLSPIDLLVVP